MKILRKLVFHYLIVICSIGFLSILSGLFFSPLLSAYTFHLFQLDHEEHQALYISLFVLPPMLIFLLINIYFSKKMADIFSYFYSWITSLSLGSYQVPRKPKRGKWTFSFFYLFQELYEKMEQLSASLKESEESKKGLENLRKDWTSGVTHDLKTPLSYIQGYSNLLLQKKYEWTEEEKDQFITLIHEKALHMKELIDDLNAAFQFEREGIPLDKQRHNVIELLNEIKEDVSHQPNQQQSLVILLTDVEKLFFSYDKHLLRRAITNIVMNAVIHNPDGTVVEIKPTISNKGDLRIEIKDNGKGLTEQEISRLFERYYRGSSTDVTEGSGLGMSIAQQLIKAHQGHIDVRSIVNHGTTITITLPFH